MQKKLHIKKDDLVRVNSGENNGKEGKIVSIDRTKNRAIVEGVNLVKRHKKPDAANPQGGIIEKEAGIHISNLQLVVNGEITKTGRKKDENGNLVRYSKKSGEVI